MDMWTKNDHSFQTNGDLSILSVPAAQIFCNFHGFISHSRSNVFNYVAMCKHKMQGLLDIWEMGQSEDPLTQQAMKAG